MRCRFHASAPDAGVEQARLAADARRRADWKRWAPCLAEREWGAVREHFDGGTARSPGAGHRAGWTSLAVRLRQKLTHL